MKAKRVVLLVEDDPNDAFFLGRALEESGFNGQLLHLTDADTAKAYLLGEGRYSDRSAHPAPDVIIADSALTARGSGVELLEWMRAANLEKAPAFVILSGALEQRMRERAEAAGVKRVLLKMANYRETGKQLRELFAELGTSEPG